MIELVVPASSDADLSADDRLEHTRELVGRDVYLFDGSLDDARSLATDLSQETQGAPVLVNDVREHDEDSRIVDVYMHRDGRQMSVSKSVKRPQPG